MGRWVLGLGRTLQCSGLVHVHVWSGGLNQSSSLSTSPTLSIDNHQGHIHVLLIQQAIIYFFFNISFTNASLSVAGAWFINLWLGYLHVFVTDVVGEFWINQT